MGWGRGRTKPEGKGANILFFAMKLMKIDENWTQREHAPP